MLKLNKCPFLQHLALILSMTLIVSPAFAGESFVEFDISPNRCVALNEGQVCYQTLEASWQSDQKTSLCLIIKDEEQPLVCWDDVLKGKVTIEFGSSRSLVFQLHSVDPPPGGEISSLARPVAAEAEVIVTWVYSESKKKRSSWRLF